MSTRQLRRFRHLNAKKQEPEEPQSDESDEFAAYFAKVPEPNNNSFKVLKQKKKKVKKKLPDLPVEDILLDSDDDANIDVSPSDSEEEKQASSESEQSVDSNAEKKMVKHSRNKKKNRNKRKISNYSDSDNIEHLVAEVNKMLGSPAPRVAASSSSQGENIFRVDPKFLDPKVDISRLLGPTENDVTRKRPDHQAIILKRRIRVFEDKYVIEFKGLAMEKICEKDGIKYFRYSHDGRYEWHLRQLVETMRYVSWAPPTQDFPVDTLEGFLQTLDLYFYADESSLASRAMEGAITYVQTVFAPAFSYFNGKTRLEYKYVENRPFHLLMLKYIHLLTNKACHRTALEIAKVLLNLDPSDPLALIFIIDVIALRARRHEWLLSLYTAWARSRDAARLFNMAYSRALAQYNVHLKTKAPEDLTTATEYVRQAIISYPNVALSILELSQRDVSTLEAHTINTLTKTTTSEALRALQSLHCRLVWPKWREADGALGWLQHAYRSVASDYDTQTDVKNLVTTASEQRSRLFLKHPLQVKRHLFSIASMSQLISDGAVPPVERTISFNPYPEEGESVDPRRYYPSGPEPADSYLRSFLSSIVHQLDENNDA